MLFRAESEWKRIVGDELWSYLEESNRLIKSKNYRTQFVTPANIGKENYNIVKDSIFERLQNEITHRKKVCNSVKHFRTIMNVRCQTYHNK